MPRDLQKLIQKVTEAEVQPLEAPALVHTKSYESFSRIPDAIQDFPLIPSPLDLNIELPSEGVISLLETKHGKHAHWVIDAEPPIMDLFSRVFPRSQLAHKESYSVASQSDFRQLWTHRPRSMADGLDTRREMVWFISRFPLFIKRGDLAIMHEGAIEHARLLADTRKIIEAKDSVELAEERLKLQALDFALPLRPHQEIVAPLTWRNQGLLLADVVGAGKTASGLSVANRPDAFPALIVCPPHLCRQWEREAARFLPGAKVHLIRSTKMPTRGLPEAHFYITAYTRVHGLVEYFAAKDCKTKLGAVILDEVHELRNSDTRKYTSVESILEKSRYRIGLSATPVMNYGLDVFNIIALLRPGSIGNKAAFIREWCNFDRLRDPKLFGAYLKKQGLMLRRTLGEIGRNPMEITQVVLSVDSDLAALEAVDKEARSLALMVMANAFSSNESRFAAERQLDYKLRQATGVAKARAVAEVVKSIVQSGEQVLLYGWHKAVYAIWKEELASLSPAFYNGDSTDKEKQSAVEAFQAGTSRVLVMSLASGQGIDGLQRHASHVVFGELDWTPGRHEQCIGRLAREGQEHPVTATFVTVEDGSDPVMVQILGLKRSEAAIVLSPDKVDIALPIDDDAGKARMQSLARQYLESKGESIPENGAAVSGHLADGLGHAPAVIKGSFEERLIKLLQTHEFVSVDEKLMGDQLENLFLADAVLASLYKREQTISKTSRLDFLIGAHVIELKVMGASKTETYSQLKRYASELGGQIDSIILLCPWQLHDFVINGTVVRVVTAGKHLA